MIATEPLVTVELCTGSMSDGYVHFYQLPMHAVDDYNCTTLLGSPCRKLISFLQAEEIGWLLLGRKARGKIAGKEWFKMT